MGYETKSKEGRVECGDIWICEETYEQKYCLEFKGAISWIQQWFWKQPARE